MTVAGQTLLKAGASHVELTAQLADWRTILGLTLYGGSSVLYIAALRRIPMSVAMPSTALSYVAAAPIGYYRFGEPLTAAHVAAIIIICAGVVLLAYGEAANQSS